MRNHPQGRAQPTIAAKPGRNGSDSTTIRAALFPRQNAPAEVVELTLSAPGPGEVIVRIEASGLCHSDLSAVDGTIPTRLPAVLGHEGSGIVEALGPGVANVSPGQHVALSWAPYCGHCETCLRDLPHMCEHAGPAMFAGGLLDGTTRLSHHGQPVYHYSLISSFAERAVVPAACCVPIPSDIPFPVAALVGCAVATGVGAVWRTAGVRPGERVAVFGCGGVGMSAIMAAAATGAAPIVAIDTRADKLETALRLGATDVIEWSDEPGATSGAVRRASQTGVDYAFEATGRSEVMRAAFESTRARGAAVMIGIPAPDTILSIPALDVPRGERRVIGSLYGSVRPERDFPLLLDLYRASRLPLDELISHRLPLAEIETGMKLLQSGAAVRVVVEPNSDRSR